MSDRIGLGDLVRAPPGMVRHTPQTLLGAATLLTMRPTTRASVGQVFATAAARYPERLVLTFEGIRYSYGQANEQVNAYAAVLAWHGVRTGDVVGILAENRPDTLLVALAAVKLGAIAGMLDHSERGEVLEHRQRTLGSRVLVAGSECRVALHSVPEPVGKVLGLEWDGEKLAGYPDLFALAADAAVAEPPACARVTASSTAFSLATSGAISHGRWLKGMAGLGKMAAHLRSADTLYCCLPLYTNNALTVSLATVLAGGATLALGRTFSTPRFWDDIVHADATAFCYTGELCRYLINQPPRPIRRGHRVRLAIGDGLPPEIWSEFQNRFGIEKILEFSGGGLRAVNRGAGNSALSGSTRGRARNGFR